jgi:hypothetical protein
MSIELEMMHDAVRDVACPRCGAGVEQRCVNPVSTLEARVPCLARAKAADTVEGRRRSSPP